MSLSQAFVSAISGLRVTQAGLSVVASNVANAQTPGYIRKTLNQAELINGDAGISAQILGINRALDQFVQRQLRTETSGGAFADLNTQFYQRLQNVYGAPGSASALETVYNNFTTALQSLSTTPDSTAARNAVLSAAQVLTQQLNSMTLSVQGLRSDAEAGLAASVASANDAMQKIADVNQRIGTSTNNDATVASLLDQRDQAIDQLSQLMDIRVINGDGNQVLVFTGSGVQLVGNEASQLSFDSKGTLTASQSWNADPTKRSVGTITLNTPGGGASSSLDLIAINAIRSGQIAAYVDMRDDILVQAQTQLDQIAAGLASALSDVTTPGLAATVGAQTGFDVDIGSLIAGNTINFTYNDKVNNVQRKVTVVRVDDPSVLPLPDNTTADPADRVIGIDFTGGIASVVAQLNAAFGGHIQFSNPAGTTLRILDDGNVTSKMTAASTTATETSFTGGIPQLPFFVDGIMPFSNAVTGAGPQNVGFAGRIAVNANLLANPANLVVYQIPTPVGDATRPNFLYSQLTSVALTFLPQSGIGSATAPYSGTVTAFINQVLSQQGQAAATAQNLSDGQEMVVNALKKRFNAAAGVNIDEEMTNLLALQNAYAANARVLSTAKDMIDALMKM